MSIFKVNGRVNIPLLVFLVIIIEGVGLLSGALSGSGPMDYQQFLKPSFAPPAWLFPIVWTILYFLMAVALYRILLWGTIGKRIGKATVYFVIQLILNFLWSIIFFGFGLYGLAFFELLLLLFFIILTIIEFSKIDKKAAWLMVPYLLWVTFAAVLNFFIWVMN